VDTSGRGVSSEKERYLRWLEMEWEHRMGTSREEQWTAEVLEVLRAMAEESGCLAVPPGSEPEGSRWRGIP
jgi:hypothetical protein